MAEERKRTARGAAEPETAALDPGERAVKPRARRRRLAARERERKERKWR